MLLLIVAALILVRPASAQAQPSDTSFRAADLLSLETLRDVQLSPSGRNVAYTVRRAVPSPAGPPVHRTGLYVAPAAGRGRPRQLTRTPGAARQPAWHPDGTRIAFVRAVEGTPQVFVLSLSGGEPYQLTDAPHGATHPQWSPSGDRLLFASAIPEPALHRQTGRPPPSDRPGRTPGDLLRPGSRDTLLVLRDETSLAPLDTLSIGPEGLQRPSGSDTSRVLRTPEAPSLPEQLRPLSLDSLRALSPDSLRSVFAQLRLRPDTVTVAVPPDTAASPGGDLLRTRRWLDQRPPTQAQVLTRPMPQTDSGLAPIPTYRHYFVVDVPRAVTIGTPPRPSARPVTRGYRSYRGGTWLPGGSQIVVSAPPPGPRHPDRVRARSLYVVDLAPYRIERLLRLDGYALTDPQVTTDGTTLAFRAEALGAPASNHAEIGLFELDGRSAPQLITAGFDHDVRRHRWSPDGWYLYVTAPARAGRPLYRFAPFARRDTAAARRQTSLEDDYTTSRDTFALDSTMVHTAPHRRMLGTDRVVQAFDVTNSNAIYAALGPQTPSELYANTISFNNERRLSAHNAGWTARRASPRTEWVHAWNGSLLVPGRLTRPRAPGPSAGAPLVVVPRGGPDPLNGADPVAQWAERRYLAGRGYAVLEVWPRGSVGFGQAYRRANTQDWGPGPASDVLTLADTVAARTGIDGSQRVLAGRSYGASLAAWLLGHTDQFRAAVAQGGVYDLRAFFGESPAGPVLANQFGGFPWATTPPDSLVRAAGPPPLLSAGLLPSDAALAPRTAVRRSAPLASAPRIETPLLLLHGRDDALAAPAQSRRLYRELKARGQAVEYVRYPGVGHGFSGASPRQRVDRLLRLHEFFARYVGPGRPPASASVP
ncbi:MAG: prolyl oligopeptidase family serine peptidase [Salinibacter sp.]